jgi:hypothetical protein
MDPGASIEFRSPEKTAFLNMTLLTEQADDAVSLKFAVEAAARGFAARTETWVERIPLAEFAAALRDLERTRTGRAELLGEDPEDLALTLSAIDRVGHVLLEFSVTRLSLVGDAAHPVTLRFSGGFELDPGLLPSLAYVFTALARER